MSDLRSIEALRGVLREEWALAFMEDPSLADSVLAEVDELAARAERYREALQEIRTDEEVIGEFPHLAHRIDRALSDSLTET